MRVLAEAQSPLRPIRMAPSPAKARSMASPSKNSAMHVRHDLEFFDMESACERTSSNNMTPAVSERRKAILRRQTAILEQVERQFQRDFLDRIPEAIRNMSVRDWVYKYGMDNNAAQKAVIEERNARLVAETAAAAIEKPAPGKKRKRTPNPTPVIEQTATMESAPGSPQPNRAAKRGKQASIEPVAGPSKGGKGARRVTRSRSRSAQPSPARSPPSTVKPDRSVYQRNPALPPTPSIASRATMSQAGRRPQRNESIQAYSMNGSPLGVGVVEARTEAAPTGDFTFRMALPDSMVAGLKAQLDATSMPVEERRQLEKRLLELMSGFSA